MRWQHQDARRSDRHDRQLSEGVLSCVFPRPLDGFSNPNVDMMTPQTTASPEPGSLVRIVEAIQEQLVSLHRLVGPDLRRLIDSVDMPSSTANVIQSYGSSLLKVVLVLKESAAKLVEAVSDPAGRGG
jgi:hypothetical protein